MNLARCVEALNLLGDESRLRLCALLRERELCVSDLVKVTGISQSRVSTHLGRLREAGIVRDRRQGAQSFYTLALTALPDILQGLLDEATQAADPTLEGDRQRLAELEVERRGGAAAAGDELERDYSPGRTWHSLAAGLSGLLALGDVLDVGSGDGAAAAMLAPYCRSLTCVDVNARLLEVARDRLAKHPHVQVELNRHTRPRQISYGALILAMNTGRLEPTERTESSRLRRYQIEDDSLTGGCEGRETEASRPR